MPIKPFLKRLLHSHITFALLAAIFIFSLAGVTHIRAGKDLKVGLFGVTQVLEKKSPYDNPTDPPRPLFRYAPGFAILQAPFLLKSKMTAPFVFENIEPSIWAWFGFGVVCLLLSAFLLLKLAASSTPKEINIRNLKLSILFSLPLIGYELSNGQNKLLALSLMLTAIFFFERKRMFLSAIFSNLALSVYIPLFAFTFYFMLRGRAKFLLNFLMAAFLVFIFFPSLVFGFDFNFYLLNEWFGRCLKPFFLTTTYASYIDLRTSSQSLPSAVGRIFCFGRTGNFEYLISPLLIHLLIRALSAAILACSCLAVLKHLRQNVLGLSYALFFILALILPQYCIYYTWSWVFVFYFFALNYRACPQTSRRQKKLLSWLVALLTVSTWLISIRFFNRLSFLFWTTLIFWAGLVSCLLKQEPELQAAHEK